MTGKGYVWIAGVKNSMSSEGIFKAREQFSLIFDDVKGEGVSDEDIIKGMAQVLGFLMYLEVLEGNENIISEVEKIIKGEIENG